MTAEIAILNRSAVALAADSAVTITVGKSEKIYNSAEKIFEFSRQSSIGLMIFNSLDYLGFPWDVLVRRFRAEHDVDFSTVKEAATAFLGYLRSLPITTQNEDTHLAQTLDEVFNNLSKEYVEDVSAAITASNNRQFPDIRVLFQSKLREYIDAVSKEQLVHFIETETQDTFNARYGGVVVSAANRAFQIFPLSEDDYSLIHQLAFALVKGKSASYGFTGLVFAGYARSDFFPSIFSFHIDGRYFGALKWWPVDDSGVTRDDRQAIIAPFAQREMVDRFVYGIDDIFERSLVEHVEGMCATVTSKIIEFINTGRRRKLKLPDDLVSGLSTQTSDDFKNLFLNDLKRVYLRDTYDIVTAMPKSELAQMAEALVSLTSTKRRMSLSSETVGGPVDVALITKGEGFVWIKRKHYFDADRNPGYFAKHYNHGGAKS